jgi:hypothetical protein
MPSFTRLIRFESAEDGQIYFADLGADVVEPPSEGSSLRAYASFNDLLAGKSETIVTLGKVMTFPKHTVLPQTISLTKIKYQLLAPLPHSGIPIYCVGLNYRTHAEEAKVRYAPRSLSKVWGDKYLIVRNR